MEAVVDQKEELMQRVLLEIPQNGEWKEKDILTAMHRVIEEEARSLLLIHKTTKFDKKFREITEFLFIYRKRRKSNEIRQEFFF